MISANESARYSSIFLKAILTILGCTAVVGAIGASVGYGLGAFVPSYYRSLFLYGREPWFDPVSIGFGQGLTQGIVGGVMVGVAVVAILVWREIRLLSIARSMEHAGEQSPQAKPVRRVLLITGLSLSLVFCLCSGLVFGLFRGERNAYYRQYLEEKEAVTPLLASDPAFANVELCERSSGGVYAMGTVPTTEDLSRLQSGMNRALGERRTREVLIAVSVKR